MKSCNNTRSLWPVAITGFFIVAAVFLATFVVWAARQREDLVSANYYEAEVRYEEQLKRLNRSLEFEGETVVVFDPARQDIVISLPASHFRGASGNIHLYRPSDARYD